MEASGSWFASIGVDVVDGGSANPASGHSVIAARDSKDAIAKARGGRLRADGGSIDLAERFEARPGSLTANHSGSPSAARPVAEQHRAYRRRLREIHRHMIREPYRAACRASRSLRADDLRPRAKSFAPPSADFG